MRQRMYSVTTAILALAFSAGASGHDLFSGTWCVGHEGLVITFVGKDSLHVTSLRDESIDGRGTYAKKGSTLTATLRSEEVELKMGYRYKVREDSTIRARILFFTVDGDSVNHPRRWLHMVRCDPAKGIVPDDEPEGELEEESGEEAGDRPEGAPEKKPEGSSEE
jgi:hypothetical protein